MTRGLLDFGIARPPSMSRVEGQRTGVAFPPLNECQRQAPPSGLLVPGLLLLVLLLLGRGRSRGRLYTRRLQHYSVRSVVCAVGDTGCLLRSTNTLATLPGRGVLGQGEGQRKMEKVGVAGSSCHCWGTARRCHPMLERRLRDRGQGRSSLGLEEGRLGG